VSARRGVTVVETLVALLLGWLVAYLALTTLAKQRTVMSRLMHRSEALAAVRTARVVLGSEGRRGAPVRDGWRRDGSTLEVRAYRGIALPCLSLPGSAELIVRVEGDRRPDPAKDSVLVVDFTGGGPVRALLERAPVDPADCGDGGTGPAERWVLSEGVSAEGALLRYFERGSYHLDAGALRYRRGLGGRQPLTPEVLATPSTGFGPLGRLTDVRVVTQREGGDSAAWPGVLIRSGEEPGGR